jgi:hypothetical protein
MWFARKNTYNGNTVAVIKQGNSVIQKIDLSDIAQPYEFEIADENGGHNKIRVENGKIAVIDADCPDKICVEQGYINNSAVPIVCLPHKLSITIIGGADEYADAVAGVN